MHVASLAGACGRAGWHVTVCGPAATDVLFGFGERGATFVPLPVGLGLLARPADRRRLRTLAEAHSVVHAHGLQAGVTTGLLDSDAPLLVSWHNAPVSGGARRVLHQLLERVAARRARITVGASADLVVRARSAGARDARFVPVAPPRLPPASADLAELRSRLRVGDRPVVLALGRLHRQKRLDVLVQAAGHWKHRDPVPVVLIAGDGPERDPLLRLVIELGVDVRLLGRRRDVADLMAVADVVVLPSSWEARPLAAQEALTAGRALVATPVGGVEALVGPAAVLVAVGDAAALSSAVLRILDDPQERHRLEAAALVRAAQWPDAAAVAEQLMAIYDELVDGS